MASQFKFELAKQFAQDGNYSEARKVLLSIGDDPKAQAWLAKLDQVEREQQAARPAQNDPPPFSHPLEEKPKNYALTEQTGHINNPYSALKMTANAYLWLAILTSVLTVVGAVAGLFSRYNQLGNFFSALIVGAFSCLALMVAREVLMGFVELIHNSRRQVKLLEKLLERE